MAMRSTNSRPVHISVISIPSLNTRLIAFDGAPLAALASGTLPLAAGSQVCSLRRRPTPSWRRLTSRAKRAKVARRSLGMRRKVVGRPVPVVDVFCYPITDRVAWFAYRDGPRVR
jgi:hypothetical protein